MTTDNELRVDHHHRHRHHHRGQYGSDDLPAQWDWRNVDGHNYITPAQDQGPTCLSSTAFAVTSVMNARLRIYLAIALNDPRQILVPDLSVGDLFNCGGGTCKDGQDIETALAYATTKGIVPAYNIPYTPADPTCGRGSADLESRVTRISGFNTLRSVQAMKTSIQMFGPVIASLQAYQDLKTYKSGVYRYNGSAPFLNDQTVCVIGYNADGWLCKNSWGPNWGTGGVFCIAYGECGIDEEAMWEIAGFTTLYPYGTVSGTPASTGLAPLRILYRDNYDTIQYLSAYPPSATQPVPLDGLAAGSDPTFATDSNRQSYAFRTDILGNIQYNIWKNGSWSAVTWLTGPQGLTGGPPAVGDLAVVGGPFALYRDADGHIQNVYFDVAQSQWKWQQVTGGTGIAAPPAVSDPITMEAFGDLHVFYRSADGNIQDLTYASHSKWIVQQVTGGGLTKAPAAIGNPNATVYNDLLRVFYRDKSGVVQQLWFDRHTWNWQVLPIKTPAVGDVASVTFNGYLHLFYREAHGYIWHVSWVNGWGEEQLTGPGLSGGELAEGDPAAVSFGSEIHVLYRDIYDNLSDAYWTGTTWTHLVRI